MANTNHSSKKQEIKQSQRASPASLGLRRVKLLEGVEPALLEQIARQCAWCRYEAGQSIVSRELPGRDVYLMIAGRVRVTIYTASGRQVTFRDLNEGHSFGEIAAIDGRGRSADVVALTEVSAAAMPQPAFRQLLRSEPLIAERFMEHCVTLIRLLSDRVVELSTLGVQNRIHAELLRLARSSDGTCLEGPCRISPSPKHTEIASRVSTTREQVTRELSALTRRGLLAESEGDLVITQIGELHRIVERASMGA